MNILVLGSGGREHVICWKLRKSPEVRNLYCAPGNAGTVQDAVNVNLPISEPKDIISFCVKKGIDLVVVGPEDPLAIGITDNLENEGIKVFGPSYAAARLESSKIFAKELTGRYNIPTAPFRIFDSYEKAKEYITSIDVPIVVKAYGLAAGKGVVIAETKDDAIKAAENMLVEKRFGAAGQKIIIEEYLTGEEASILVITDGTSIIPLATSQDHKRVYDGDVGPNTGGMGAYSPAPVISEKLFNEIIETIIRPTIEGLKNEGIVYKGVLYAGIMITPQGPKVLEYNVRFGDPETQVILPRMKSDLADLMMLTANGEISGKKIEWDEQNYVCVVLVSGGYPGEYEKGKRITGCAEAAASGALIFHGGTRFENGSLVTSGGRVLNVVGKGGNIKEAAANTYSAVEKIRFDGMYYRKDIGYRAIARA